MQPTLVVLAAGMGSRYGGLKQIDPVGPNQEAILDYSVYDARQAGFDRVVFIIRRDIETDFRELVGKRFENAMDTDYAFQELDALPAGFKLPASRKKPWGTAHAVLCSKELVKSPFAAINADDFYGADSYRAMAEFLIKPQSGETAHLAMGGFVLRNTLSEHGYVARGICEVNDQGLLQKVTEHTKITPSAEGAVSTHDDGTTTQLTGNEWVSMNFWGFTPALFPALEEGFAQFLTERKDDAKAEFYITAAIDDMMNDGIADVRVLPSEARWFGVTYREDKAAVQTAIREMTESGAYPSPLWPAA